MVKIGLGLKKAGLKTKELQAGSGRGQAGLATCQDQDQVGKRWKVVREMEEQFGKDWVLSRSIYTELMRWEWQAPAREVGLA